MKRKIKYIIEMIWWQFRKKKIKGDCLRGLGLKIRELNYVEDIRLF